MAFKRLHQLSSRVFTQLALVAFAGLLVYSNTLYSPFVFDDLPFILENKVVKDFTYFADPFSLKAAEGVIPEIRSTFFTRYVTYLTFAANRYMGGDNPFGYHMFNIVTHILSAWMLYWLARSITAIAMARSIDSFPLFCALIFVCHPLQTQAVTYIWQRNASLATFFYLLSFASYARFRSCDSSRRIFYMLALVSTVTAMHTKEMTFTLPVMILLFDLMFIKSGLKERVKVVSPFLILMSIIPAWLMLNPAGVAKAPGDVLTIYSSTDYSRGITAWNYFLTQLHVVTEYIGLLLVPVGQNLDHDHPVHNSCFESAPFLSSIFLVSLAVCAIYLYTRYKDEKGVWLLVSFGIAWFFITISVESSFVPIADVMHEHRVYLPSVGFIIAMVAILHTFKGERGVIVMSVAVLILALTAYDRNSVWASPVKLWTDAVSKSPKKARPRNNLAIAYERTGDYERAALQFTEAVRLDPDLARAHHNLANIRLKQGQLADAEKEYRIAVGLVPWIAVNYYGLGMVYEKMSRPDLAEKEYRITIEKEPSHTGAHFALGRIYLNSGNLVLAKSYFKIATGLRPDIGVNHLALGIVHLRSGELETAQRSFAKVLELEPDNETAKKELERIRR